MRRNIGAVDWSKYIIPAGVIVGGYLVLKETGLLGGSAANSANNDAVTAGVKSSVATSIQQDKNSGGFATINSSQAQTIADSVFQQAITSGADQDQIVYQVIQVNTLQDLLLVIQAFGTRNVATSWLSTCGFVGYNCQAADMGSVLRGTLDAAHIATINTYFSNQGINYSF